jgi:spore coat polysaccharide biosynthesis protein SpsF (cytidylyltransferase family)
MLKDYSDCAVVIQARHSSARLPGKVLMDLAGMPLLEFVYRRCKASAVTKVVVATSTEEDDDQVYNFCRSHSLDVFRGSLNNVLERYIRAAEGLGVKYLVRVCADSPFVETSAFSVLLDALKDRGFDYAAIDKKTTAAGFICEAFTLAAAKKAAGLAVDQEDLEHVTRYFINHAEEFKTGYFVLGLGADSMNGSKLTVDFPEDLENARKIAKALKGDFTFRARDVLEIADKQLLGLRRAL